MKATQTKYFQQDKIMNDWLKDNGIIVKDIKMTATQYQVHYLVIYEREFKERIVKTYE